MTIKMYGKNYCITADNGNKLVNIEQRVIGKTVFVGKNGALEDWVEMSDADADALRQQWENENRIDEGID